MASGGPDCTHADSTSPNRKAYYAYTWPFGLPGDTALLFNRWGGTAEDLMRLNLADMSQDVIAPRQWRRSTRTASGHIVFSAEGGDFLGIPDGPTGRAPEPLIANMAGGDDPDGYTVSEPDVAVDAGWTLGQEVALGGYKANYDVMRGGRFLMVRHAPESIPQRITVIFNWFDELRLKIPVK